jgi:hypothetical protein
MGFNKDLLQLVILQLLSSGAFGYIFELIESEYTSAIQFGEHILRTIQTAMNFAIYTNGYFYNKVIRSIKVLEFYLLEKHGNKPSRTEDSRLVHSVCLLHRRKNSTFSQPKFTVTHINE